MTGLSQLLTLAKLDNFRFGSADDASIYPISFFKELKEFYLNGILPFSLEKDNGFESITKLSLNIPGACG